MIRTLIAEDDTRRVYEVKDDSGTVVGRDVEFKPTVEETVERDIDTRLDNALDGLRAFVSATKPGTAAAQASAAYDAARLLARVAIALIRLRRNRLDSAD